MNRHIITRLLIVLIIFFGSSLSGLFAVTSVTTTTDPVTCNGLNNGKIYVQVTGTANFNYRIYKNNWPWSGGILNDSLLNNSNTSVTFINKAPGKYYVIIDDQTEIPGFAVVTVTEPDPFVVTSIFVNKGLSCFNSCDAALKVSVSGGNKPYTFAWTKLSPPPVTPLADSDSILNNICQGTFQVVVNDQKNCGGSGILKSFPFVISNPLARDSIPSPLVGGTIGSTQTICYNYDVPAFSSSLEAQGGSESYTYTWRYSTTSNVAEAGIWTDIPGSNSPTFDYGTLTQTTHFVRRAVDPVCGTVFSNVITVTVRPEFTPGIIAASQTICYNTIPASFTSTDPANGGGGFTYQWQSKVGVGAWTNITGATAETYTVPTALTQTTDYRRAAISTQGCGTIYSNIITITVYPQMNGGTIAASQSICYNTIPAAFTSSAPASGGGGVTYQWQSKVGAGAWANIAGATNETYAVPSALTQTTDYRRAATSTQSCGTVYSNTVTVTVYAQMAGGTIATSQSICYNTIPVAFTSPVAASGGGTITYQWESKVGAGAWAPIAGATSATYSETSALTQTTDYRRAATSSNGCGTVYSNIITVTVYPQMNGGTIDASQSICYNTIPAAFTSSAPASGGGGVTYQWQSKVGAAAWANIAGATNETYAVPSALTQTTDYRRAAVSSNGCGTVYSNTVTVTVYAQMAGGTIAASQSICYNTIPAAFISSAPASGGGGVTYQWQSKVGAGAWANIAGATNEIYAVPSALTQTTDYRRAATSTQSCGTVYSNTVTVTVYAEMAGGTIAASQSICYNTVPAAFTSPVAASGGGTITYQWESKIGAGAWAPIAGATSATYSPSALTQTTDYRRAATSSNGCGTVYSNTITITVYAQMNGGTIDASQSICYNTIPAAFTSSAPASGGGGVTYQWQSKVGAGAWANIAGATNETYAVPSALTQTTDYRRAAISSQSCGTVYSNTVTVTVYAQMAGGTIAASQSICYNTVPAAFTSSVAASGGGTITYQWESKVGAGAWAPIAGATSATYSETSALTQTTDYRRSATSSNGCGTVYSNTITVTVYAQMNGGTIDASQSICYNTIPAAFTSSAPASGGGGVTYQWQSKVGAAAWANIAGATNETFTAPALTQTTDYRRSATSTQSCGTVYSNTITITVYPQMNGGTIAASQSICYNTIPAAFTSSAPASGGGGVMYQWQSKVGAAAWANIAGATNETYAVPSALTQTTDYRRAATSTQSCGTVYSNTVTVTVYAQMAGGTIAASQSICYNTVPAAFTSPVAASGGGTITYQWESKIGAGAWAPIAGANSATYSETSALTQTTDYRRAATSSNGCGTVYSNTIIVTVYAQMNGGTIDASQSICYNTIPAAFTSSAPASGGGGVTYQWQSKVGAGAWANIAGATNETYAVPSALTQTTDYRRAAISTQSCGTVYSNTITITVYPQMNGGTIAATQSICYNTIPVAFTSSAPATGGGGVTYQWQSKVGAGAWANIAGATNETYAVPSALTQTTDYRRAATSTQSCGTVYSNTVTVTVYAQMAGGTIAASQSICYNTVPAAFTSPVAASGGGTITYQWESKIGAGAWAPIAGATSETFSPLALTQTTDYRRAATSSNGCGTVYSNTITITVYAQMNGGTIDASQSICYNTIPAAFTSSAPASGGGGVTYQWQSKVGAGAWANIAGATNETYAVPSALTQTTDYRRAATSTQSCGTVYSNTVTVTVYAQMAGGTIAASQSICYNTVPAAFTSSVAASGGGTITYQWESKVGAGAWAPIAGATSATYSETSALTQTTDYRRAATSSNGCGTVYSNTITVTPYAQMNGGTLDASQSICYNTIPAAFTSSAPASGGGGVTYQWQSKVGAGAWANIAGATNETYAVPSALTQTTDYRRAAVSSNGCGTVYSNTVTITVYPQMNGGTIDASQSICYNTIPAAFTSSAPAIGGGGVTYQWQSKVGAGAWANIAGATNETYAVSSALTQTTDYRRAATSTQSCGTVYSNTVTVTVYAQMDGGTIASSQPICYNTIPAPFTSINPASGGGTITYQWESKVGIGAWAPIAGATSETYAVSSALTQTTDYRRAATSTSGCGTVYSNTVTVTVYAELQAGTIGSDQTICYNTIPAAFTSADPASGGGGFTYQWESRIGLGSWNAIPGATNETFAETSKLTQTTDYRRAVTSIQGCGTKYTASIKITVELPPSVNAGPDDTICYISDSYNFIDVSVSNSFDLQWSTPNGDGTFFPDNILNSTYTFGTLDKNYGKGSTVQMVISATGDGSCSSTTVSDTMNLFIAPELLVAVGTPAPFIVGPNTKINVKVKVEDRNYLSDLSYYLVSPDDSVVVLKEAYDPLSYCNFGEEADLEFIRFPEPSDTLDLCPGGGGYINLSGEFKATGNWEKLHGQDPANGIWKLVIKDGADFIYKPGPEDGRMVYASIELTDANAEGDTVTLLYESGSGFIDILNTENSFIPAQTNFVVTLGLKTKCYEGCDATAVVTPAGGIGPYEIEWSNGLGSKDTIDLCAGTYTVTITDAMGCSASTTVEVESAPQIKFTSVEFTDSLLCSGLKNAFIACKATGGTGKLTYTLMPGNIPSSVADSGRFENLQGGTYTIVVRDINQCTIDTVIFIYQPAAPVFDDIIITPVTCSGGADGSIQATADGGVAPYKYWINPGTEVNNDGIFETLSEGTYTIRFTDANFCDTIISDLLTVIAPSPLTIDTVLVDSIACAGEKGRIGMVISGGTLPYYISLTGGKDSVQAVSVLRLKPGAEGKDTRINSLDVHTSGSSTELLMAAWTYSGIPGNDRGLIEFDLSSILPGADILNAELHLFGASDLPTGGHSTLSGSNEIEIQRIVSSWDENSVSWDNQPQVTSENKVVTGISTSTDEDFIINVTGLVRDMINKPDSSHGFLLKQVTEQYYRRMSFASSDYHDSTLHPQLVINYLEHGNGSYLLLRPDSASGIDAEISNWIPTSTYGATPNFDCRSWTIDGDSNDVRALISFDLSSIPSGSKINKAYLSLYSYSESMGGHSTLSGSNESVLQRIINPWEENTVNWINQPGTTTENEVLLPASTTANQDYLNIDITSLTQDLLDNPDSSFGLMMRLVTEERYRRMFFASSDNPDPSLHPKFEVYYTSPYPDTIYFDVAAGNYDIVVYDGGGCDAAWPSTITLKDPLPITIDSVAIENITGCYEDTTGTIYVEASGGRGQLLYSLDGNTPQTDNTFSNLSAGEYILTILDESSCSISDTFTITQPSQIIVTENYTQVTEYLWNVTLNATGGTLPYVSYSIDGTTQDTNYFENILEGEHIAIVEDSHGCQGIDTFGLWPPQLDVTIHELNDASCFGYTDGGIFVEILNGVAPFDVLITDSITGDTLRFTEDYDPGFPIFEDMNFGTGVYRLRINDSKVPQQVYDDYFRIREPDQIVPSITAQNATCNYSSDGRIEIASTGGYGFFEYTWNTPDITDSIRTNVLAGEYIFTVTDSSGCFVTDTAIVDYDYRIDLTIAKENATCNTSPDGSLHITASGGAGDYIYNWADDITISTGIRDNLLSDVYLVTVTDQEGCVATYRDTVFYKEIINVFAGWDTIICPYTEYELKGISPDNDSIRWVFHEDDLVFSHTPDIYFKEETSLNSIVSTNRIVHPILIAYRNGCYGMDTVTIDVFPSPEFTLFKDLEHITPIDTTVYLYEGDSYPFYVAPAEYEYSWYPSNGLSLNETGDGLINLTSDSVNYIFEGISEFGCIDTFTFSVVFVRDIKIYSGFTPNDDGYNDTWIIDHAVEHGENIEIMVFNRWGERIFYSKGYPVPWDGTFKNKPLPIGTYYYIIKVNDGKSKPITGSVTLIR